MKMRQTFNFYAYPMNPNGTNDLIIADAWNQIIEVIPEALFHAERLGMIQDQLGGFMADYYGESIGYISYDNECHDELENNDQTNDVSPVIDLNDLVKKPFNDIDLEPLYDLVCCSPIDPDGQTIINQINKIINKQ